MNPANDPDRDYYNKFNRINFPESLKRLKVSARNGNADSMFVMGRLYEYGLVDYDIFTRRDVYQLMPNSERTYKWFKRAAEAGHLEAIKIVGNIEYSCKDYKKAHEWFQMGVQQGDGHCHKKLGDIYWHWNNRTQSEKHYQMAWQKRQWSALGGLCWLKVFSCNKPSI